MSTSSHSYTDDQMRKIAALASMARIPRGRLLGLAKELGIDRNTLACHVFYCRSGKVSKKWAEVLGLPHEPRKHGRPKFGQNTAAHLDLTPEQRAD